MSYDTVRPAYWAALDADRTCAEVVSRIDSYYQFIRTSQLNLWHRIYRAQFKGGIKLGKIWAGGTAGEQVLLEANHLRSINTNIVNQITQERPSFSCKAVNSDFDSDVQTKLGQQLLDYDVMREKRLETVSRDAVEFAQWYGEGWIGKFWNATAGEVVGIIPGSEEVETDPVTGATGPRAGTGKPQWTGTLEFQAFPAWEVVRDFAEPDMRKIQWLGVRDYPNKYDLAQKYPDKARDILNAPGRLESYAKHPTPAFYNNFTQMAFKMTDEVEAFWFFHEKTPALPHGRCMLIVGTTWVQDGPLPYDEKPMYRISAGRQEGTNFGYSINFDLLPIQHAVDAQYTAIATNQNAFAIQSVAVPRQAGLSPKMLGTSMVMIEYDPVPGVEGGGKPEGLNLIKTAPETFTWLKQLVSDIESISGQNATARGNPPENVSSGSMAALVTAAALNFTVNLQAAYVEAMEDVASGSIQDYIRFAELPQTALIVGKANRSYLKTFKGSDLNRIQRVTVEIENPLLKTISGRMEIANQLLAKGLVKTPKEYILVLTTGRLDPVLEPSEAELLNIRAENEALAEGKAVMALLTDDHRQHAVEHLTILASPEARTNPTLVQNAIAHVQQHFTLAATTDPRFLTFLGIEPFPPPPPPNPDSQATYEAVKKTAETPGAPGQISAAQDVWKVAGPPQPGQPAAGNNGAPPREPQMPKGPKNPLTHETVPVHQPAPGVVPPGVKPSA